MSKMEGVNKRKRGEGSEDRRAAAVLLALIKLENADAKAKVASFLTPCEGRELSPLHSTLRTAVETSSGEELRHILANHRVDATFLDRVRERALALMPHGTPDNRIPARLLLEIAKKTYLYMLGCGTVDQRATFCTGCLDSSEGSSGSGRG